MQSIRPACPRLDPHPAARPGAERPRSHTLMRLAAFLALAACAVAMAQTPPVVLGLPLAAATTAPLPLVDDEGHPLPPAPEAVPLDPRSYTYEGHYVSALQAHAAKQWLGRQVLFVDVRERASVEAEGSPLGVDLNLPVLRASEPGTTRIDFGFAAALEQALAARGLAREGLVLLICENGRHSAIAAELLSRAGVSRVFLVRGGIRGEVSADGEKAGWLAARLPLQSQADRERLAARH